MHYFDNAATTFPKPEQVYAFMDTFYRNSGVNVGRGQFSKAAEAASLVAETRKLLLELFKCNSSYEVVFTPSATQALNTIMQGLNFTDGQVVYITPFEHNAVLRTLAHLKTILDLKVEFLDVDKITLNYDLEKIKYSFQKNRPDYVIMSHASNVNGKVAPIKDICILAKQYNATTLVDMAQTAGLIDINIVGSKVDFAVFAGHKTLYAPFGVAGFVTNQADKLQPLIYGGTGVNSISETMPTSGPERFEAGSLNISAIAGLNASLKWINEIGIENLLCKENETTDKLLELLSHYSNITVLRSKTDSIGVVSCVFDGYSSDNIGQILNEHDIAVRTGLHCAPQAHEFMDTSPGGTVRFSVSYFTNENDFRALQKALDYIEING